MASAAAVKLSRSELFFYPTRKNSLAVPGIELGTPEWEHLMMHLARHSTTIIKKLVKIDVSALTVIPYVLISS
uniref:Uncharacterized protein n=1 Tax=Arion vulgaris TaxID=1028688 RepID=A0A0B7B2A4_9EUPU